MRFAHVAFLKIRANKKAHNESDDKKYRHHLPSGLCGGDHFLSPIMLGQRDTTTLAQRRFKSGQYFRLFSLVACEWKNVRATLLLRCSIDHQYSRANASIIVILDIRHLQKV